MYANEKKPKEQNPRLFNIEVKFRKQSFKSIFVSWKFIFLMTSLKSKIS